MTAVDAARVPAQAQAQAGLPVLRRPGVSIARLEGDLDIAATPVLRERLLSMLGPGVRLLVIDLSGVAFCDVSALAVLIGMQRRARGLGITVRLAAPSWRSCCASPAWTSTSRSAPRLMTRSPRRRGRPRAAASPTPAEVPVTRGI